MDHELPRDEKPFEGPRKLDRKTLMVLVGVCVGLVLLVALNMN